jgi:hypothetical protein
MAARDRKDLDTDQARQGIELHAMRWVLHISLALAVVAGLVIYFSFFRL